LAERRPARNPRAALAAILATTLAMAFATLCRPLASRLAAARSPPL